MANLFSKRHYEWLAAFACDLVIEDRIRLREELSRYSNFNRDKFERACGISLQVQLKHNKEHAA